MEELGLTNFLCLFDLDGTLLASEANIYQAVTKARSILGYPAIQKTDLASRIGLAAKELFFDLDLSDKQSEEVVKVFREELANLSFTPLNLFNGANELLSFLSMKGCELMVATNKPTNLANQALKETGIYGYFSLVSGGEDKPPKPNPAILENCISKSNRTEIIMIGDRIEDIEAAKAIKIRSIGLAQGAHDSIKLNNIGASKVFPTINDLWIAIKDGWSFENL